MAKLNEKRMNEQEWLDWIEKFGTSITNTDEAIGLLDAVLTHAEREGLPKRLKIFEELFKGELTQRDIASKLNVSIANVTRGSNTIKAIQPHHDLKGLIEKICHTKKK
jgi:TrpR family transcriptional regulator, trp operon repressor